MSWAVPIFFLFLFESFTINLYPSHHLIVTGVVAISTVGDKDAVYQRW